LLLGYNLLWMGALVYKCDMHVKLTLDFTGDSLGS